MAESIQHIRYVNMQALYKRFCAMYPDEPERGMLRRFATYTHISPRYLSHIRNGRKAIGHNTARTLEQAFGLPESWMDVSHAELDGVAPAEKLFLQRALAAYRKNQAVASSALAIVEQAVTSTDEPPKQNKTKTLSKR